MHPREDSPEPPKKQADTRPFWVYHDRHDHSTENCFDLKRLSEKRKQEEGSGGRGRGRGYRKDGRRGGYRRPQGTKANAIEKNDNLPDEVPGGYQDPKGLMACILGGSLAPKSNNQFKQFARELKAALPGVEASQPLKWSQYTIALTPKTTPGQPRLLALSLWCAPPPSTTLLQQNTH